MNWFLYCICNIALSAFILLKGSVIRYNALHHEQHAGWAYNPRSLELSGKSWYYAQAVYGSTAIKCGWALIILNVIAALVTAALPQILILVGALIMFALEAVCYFAIGFWTRRKVIDRFPRSLGRSKSRRQDDDNDENSNDSSASSEDPETESTKSADSDDLTATNDSRNDSQNDSVSACASAKTENTPASKDHPAELTGDANETKSGAHAQNSTNDENASHTDKKKLIDPVIADTLARSILEAQPQSHHQKFPHRRQHIQNEIHGNGYEVDEIEKTETFASYSISSHTGAKNTVRRKAAPCGRKTLSRQKFSASKA